MFNKIKKFFKGTSIYTPYDEFNYLSEKGESLIKSFEGYSSKAYRCPAGVWTIGWGTTKGVYEGMEVTREQAQEMFERDLRKFVKAVKKLVDVPLTQNQFDALVSFAYNVGINAFKKSTLRRKLNDKKYDEVPEEFMRWVYAGGQKLNGLVKRRKKEAKLFQS